MREILFRAKQKNWRDLPKKEWWVEGYFFDDGFQNPEHYFVGGIEVVPYSGTADDEWDITGTYFCEIDPETLCQFTGLIDKNGKRIWENDIVSFIDCSSTESGYVEHNCVGRVAWDCECACVRVSGTLSAESWEVLQDCVVIGNIFDNPELLGQDGG